MQLALYRLGMRLFDASQADAHKACINEGVWDTERHSSCLPQRDDPILGLSRLTDRGSTFGVAFSGGGTRLATAVLGQLKALKIRGRLDPAHCVAAVSGGSPTLVPFVLSPGSIPPTVTPAGVRRYNCW